MSICLFLMGKQRAGKDTAADYLVANYGFTRSQLALPVYDIARNVFGMVGKDRGLLIQIGVKMREIDPLVFPKALWRRAVATPDNPGDLDTPLPEETRLVITDARFQNEWDFFKARGGIGLRITASQAVRQQRPGYHREYEHDATETQLDNVTADYEIINEGTIAEYHAALDIFARDVLKIAPQKA